MKKYRALLAGIAVCSLLAGLLLIYIVRYMPTSKRMEAEEYFGALADGEAVVIVEDHQVQTRAVRQDDEWYLAYELVETELNPRFYWDESIERMLFTTAEEVYEIPVDDTFYTAGSKRCRTEFPIVKRIGEELYLALDFLQEHSDFTYTAFEEPDRVVITYGSRSVMTAILQKKSEVRYLGGVKSPILTEVQKEDEVVVLEQHENWSRVCTADGYIGYVKNSCLSEAQETERTSVYDGPEYTSLSLGERVNLIWHQINYAGMNAGFSEDTAQMSGVNVISPTWYFLADSEGAIDSLADADYVEQAHAAGLQVWALISNFSENVSTTELLSSRAARRKVQEYLIAEADQIGFDGINIDFEGIAQEAGPSYVQFMRELSILCREKGLYLSVDVPVPMEYSSYYDRAELGVVCDYVIMMGYDEHYAGSEEAGSVASMSFERTGIENMLLEVPASKVVSAIPFYTRLWYTEVLSDGSTAVTSEALSMGSAWSVVEEYQATAVWDDDAGQPYAEWTDADGRLCQIWLEDDSTVAERASLVKEYDLGGIAAWVLGREEDYVWGVIEEAIQ